MSQIPMHEYLWVVYVLYTITGGCSGTNYSVDLLGTPQLLDYLLLSFLRKQPESIISVLVTLREPIKSSRSKLRSQGTTSTHEHSTVTLEFKVTTSIFTRYTGNLPCADSCTMNNHNSNSISIVDTIALLGLGWCRHSLACRLCLGTCHAWQ